MEMIVCTNCRNQVPAALIEQGKCPKCHQDVREPTSPTPREKTIHVSCPNCRKRFRAADKHAGKTAKCPECGSPVRISRQQSPSQSLPPAPPTIESPRPSRKEKVLVGELLPPDDFSIRTRKRKRKSGFFSKGKQRRQHRKGSREQALRWQQETYMAQLRSSPLMHHVFCTTCGWLGILGSQQHQTSKAQIGGTATAVGGATAGLLGGGGMTIGIILIIIGLPLLCVYGLGIIPIIIGFVLLIVGGGTAMVGTATGAAGAGTAAQASDARRAAAQAPRQCPMCNNVGLVPALSPMAQKMILESQNLTAMAYSESRRVIESLPSTPLFIAAEVVTREKEE